MSHLGFEMTPRLTFITIGSAGAALLFASPPAIADVSSAVSWLVSDQTESSHWGSDQPTRIRDTATVVEVLRRLGNESLRLELFDARGVTSNSEGSGSIAVTR